MKALPFLTYPKFEREVIDAVKGGKVYLMPSLKELGIGAAAQERLDSLDIIKYVMPQNLLMRGSYLSCFNPSQPKPSP